MQPKSNIVHLPVYKPGKPIEDVKRELGLSEVIKLASNENPFGFSNFAKSAIQEQLQQINYYPDGASVELTSALATHLLVKPEQLIFGTGSSDIILMIARAFLTLEDETIMAEETFSQYKHNAEVENAIVVEVPLVDGKHDLVAMQAAITERTKIIWICNPNNPTGTIVTNEELVAFLDKVPDHVMVVLDEAYGEYVEDPSFSNGIQLLDKYHNLVLLRTFSKIYGLASLRIGYGIGDPEIIAYINQVREPFNTTRLAQVAAKAALADDAFLSYCREQNRAGIDFINQELERLGLDYFPAHGNFVMFDAKRASSEVFQSLLQKGIVARAGWKNYPNWIRISVGTMPQNEKFIAALEQVLQEVTVQ
ncbi:histidinol-phosphate transaminase [Paenibacillus yanchengensis]|uniref:Histidinol-phosphate aminotransferase n=1 Tax=Paenibacillus yanchengensis TaxID=2035833 RepID=A0ABW4YK84_9BACL